MSLFTGHGIINLIKLVPEAQGVPRTALESVQDMLLKMAQQIYRNAFASSIYFGVGEGFGSVCRTNA